LGLFLSGGLFEKEMRPSSFQKGNYSVGKIGWDRQMFHAPPRQ
jgi:hypothetical protein